MLIMPSKQARGIGIVAVDCIIQSLDLADLPRSAYSSNMYGGTGITSELFVSYGVYCTHAARSYMPDVVELT